MGFSEAASHGVIVNSPSSVFILTGQKTMTSFTMPSNTNYEYFALQSDGTNFRILTATQATARFNGIFGTVAGQQWQYLFSTGYSATLTDNGLSLSSLLAGGDVTITLPSTGVLPNGWSFTVYTGGGNAIILQPNGVSGGTLVNPLGAAVSTYTIPGSPASNHEVVSFDGGSFRVEAGGRLTADTGTGTGHFYKPQGAIIDRFGDRVFVGAAANANTGVQEPGPPGPQLQGQGADWLSQLRISTTSVAQLATLARMAAWRYLVQPAPLTAAGMVMVRQSMDSATPIPQVGSSVRVIAGGSMVRLIDTPALQAMPTRSVRRSTP
jgi:hypothetical protein